MASKVKEVICRQFGRSCAAHARPAQGGWKGRRRRTDSRSFYAARAALHYEGHYRGISEGIHTQSAKDRERFEKPMRCKMKDNI